MNYLELGLRMILPAALVLFGAGVLLAFLEQRIARATSENRLPMATAASLRIILRSVIGLLAVLAVAMIFGVRLASLWAGISALLAMIAIGFFAGWSLMSSALATIIIMLWHPYKVGDTIEIPADSIRGRLREMNMMFSTIVDEEGSQFIVPNSQMLQKIVKVVKTTA
jgi:small-conductance mechanosensitive channel